MDDHKLQDGHSLEVLEPSINCRLQSSSKSPMHINFVEIFQQMDTILCSLYEPYDKARKRGSIGQLKILQVRKYLIQFFSQVHDLHVPNCHIVGFLFPQVSPGSFHGLCILLRSNQANPQFKMPRVLHKEPALKYLISQKLN